MVQWRNEIFGGEDVTISANLPPSLVTVSHKNLQISGTSLSLPAGDVIFEWPPTAGDDLGTSQVHPKDTNLLGMVEIQ